MDDYEWLGTWDDTAAPGAHSGISPAPDGHGYPLIFPQIDKRPKPPEMPYTMWDRVNRAIPVEGRVDDGGPSWQRSPQARFWLEPEKIPLGRRIRNWIIREMKRPLAEARRSEMTYSL